MKEGELVMKETIYEVIQYHNALLNEFQEFGGVLCDTYSDIDDTPANDKYFEVISKFREEGIFLCCEANQYDNNWMMTEDGYVMTDKMLDEFNTGEYKASRWAYKED